MLKAIVIILLLAAAAFGVIVLIAMRKTRELARAAETAVPPNGRFVKISTGRLHYVEAGQGPSVLVIHGLGGQLRSLSHWLAEPLSRRFRVVFVDRPGMGYSDRPDSASARIDDQAGYMEEVIDTLDLGRTIVVGHSLGGAIACALALRCPEKIAGLALVAPLLRPSTTQTKAFAALGVKGDGMRRFIAQSFAVPTTAKNQDVTRDEVFGPDPIPRDYTVAGGGLLSLRPRTFFNTSRDYVSVGEVMPAQWKRYDEIVCPVRVIYGTEDRILDYKEQGVEVSERYRHFKLTTLPGKGHMIPLTAPQEVVKVIEDVADAAGT
ncbi:alpha/beta fold hydrolase [Maritimibacter dapengensis]|uniref:Alpha/beta hydrolase n=1 Tax=Maritimibacter dapengensis TaxID=2836868 RepID=A0ABS6T244_9RHOB|nr:alpha/beta hydrolase [Maritimibacter dapengensis]MBV7379265.1 alpha/beta hydrolase [Maritimibacter dapengensis]